MYSPGHPEYTAAAAAGLRRFVRGDRVRVTHSADTYRAGEMGTVTYTFGFTGVVVEMDASGRSFDVNEIYLERIPDKPIVVEDDDEEDIRIADLMVRAPAAAAAAGRFPDGTRVRFIRDHGICRVGETGRVVSSTSTYYSVWMDAASIQRTAKHACLERIPDGPAAASSSAAAAAPVKVTAAAIARFQDYKRNGRLCSVPIADLPRAPLSQKCPHCSIILHHSKPAKLYACPDCERKWDSDRVFHVAGQELEDAVRATPIEHVSVIAIGAALSDRTSPPTYEDAMSPEQPKKKRKSRASSSSAAAAAGDEPEAKAQHV